MLSDKTFWHTLVKGTIFFSEALFCGKHAVVIQGVCFFFCRDFHTEFRVMFTQHLCNMQPRTQALYSMLLPHLRKNAGSGWSRVSDILGDNNWNLWGVGREKFLIKAYQNDQTFMPVEARNKHLRGCLCKNRALAF